MEQVDVNRLADMIFALARDVEQLAKENRYYFGDKLAWITIWYRDAIKPEIADTPEAYDMDRILGTLEDFCDLNEREWRRMAKARKQALEMMRVATNQVVRRLLRQALEAANK
jgi:hypothetical protein